MKKVNIVPFLNNDFKKINEFINENLIDSLDLDETLNELLKLAYFLEENAASFNHSIIWEIVLDNNILSSILDTIINNIDLNDLENVIDNEMSLNLVRAYLMQKGLIPLDKEEFEDNLDFDYYKKEYKVKPIIKKEDIHSNEAKELINKPNKTEEEVWLLFTYYYKTIFHKIKYLCKGKLPFKDLLSESEIILLKSINSFEAGKTPFLYYLFIELVNLGNYIKNNGSYNHIPTYIQSKMGLLKKVIYQYDKNGLSYSKEDLAEELECSVSDIDNLMILIQDFINYDDLKDEEPYDLTSLSEESFEDRILNQMHKSIGDLAKESNLNDYKRRVVTLAYDQGIGDDVIAEDENCSRQNINCVKHEALLEIAKSPALLKEIDFVDDHKQLLDYFKRHITLEDLIIDELIVNYQNVFATCQLSDEEKEVLDAAFGLSGQKRIPLSEIAKMQDKNPGYILRLKKAAFYQIIESGYDLPYLDLVPNLDEQIEKLKSYKRKRSH